MQRLAALFALAAFGVLILVSLNARAPGGTEGARVSFQIATGPSGGTFFTIGEAIAGLVSHPPGVGRCETSMVCGPSGVILSARTSQDSIESLIAVNNGLIDSALVPGDMVQAAVMGQGPFRRQGRLQHVRVIAALFNEQVHLVVPAASRIATVRDLAGKRVFIGAPQSGAAVTVRQILSAFGVGGGFRRVDSDDPAADLGKGKLDAFFLIAGAPTPAAQKALADGKARLVPVEGAGVARLTRGDTQFQIVTIAANTYAHTQAVATLATRAVWIVNDRASDALVYGLVRALFNPANQAALAASHPAAREIELATAAQALPAPLHSGAARYYREAGKI
jgi:TRAP transporter TAXI family solute receptor